MKRSEFRVEFIKNTRRLRVKAGYGEAKEFAGYLGIPYATYAKYETRSLLPHYLIPKFCQLVHIPIKNLYDVGPKKIKERHMLLAAAS
ncbi:MAG: hypothetical protein ACYC9K_01120 [Sulfuricaulis sp.]